MIKFSLLRQCRRALHFVTFFFYGILFYLKSLPYKSALRNDENLKGGKLQAPKNLKKMDFFVFLGVLTCPP